MAGTSPSVPILMYHRIAKPVKTSTVAGHYVSPTLFNSHMRTLARLGYRTVSLDALVSPARGLPKKPIAITFDDGYAGFLSDALPVLVRYAFTATVFVVTDLMGKTNAWDRDRGDVEERLLSADEVCRCQAQGTEFGSHTLSHADLSECSAAEAWRQISESKAAVEAVTGRSALSFCYPYGRYTSGVRQMVADAGYRLACSTRKGVNVVGEDPYELKRINVRRDTWSPVLIYKLLRGARFGR